MNLQSLKKINYKEILITQFKVESNIKINWYESLIFLVFFIFLPVLWVAIRSGVYPNYANDFNNSNWNDSFKIFYPLSVFLFQIGIPLVGTFFLSCLMKKRFITSGLLLFVMIFPIRTIISLIISNIIPSISGLNSFLIDFLYSMIVIFIYLIKSKRLALMIKKSFTKNTFLITILGSLLFFGLASFLQYLLILIPQNFSQTGASSNQTSIESSKISSFGIASIFFVSVISAPLVEEITTRMIFQDMFNNKWYGWLLTTFFFSFLHIQIFGDWIWIFPYLSLGLVNGLIYFKVKNITIPIIIHLLMNLISFVSIIS